MRHLKKKKKEIHLLSAVFLSHEFRKFPGKLITMCIKTVVPLCREAKSCVATLPNFYLCTNKLKPFTLLARK